MLIKLHSQTTTTPKVCAAIQASDEPDWVLAKRHCTTKQTVLKWRKRDHVNDLSHTPHRLFGLRKRTATGAHEFDRPCAALDIEHHLTPAKSPQTGGMVERFNGRIEEVLRSHFRDFFACSLTGCDKIGASERYL